MATLSLNLLIFVKKGARFTHVHPIGHWTLLADCVSKLSENEKAHASQASLIQSERLRYIWLFHFHGNHKENSRTLNAGYTGSAPLSKRVACERQTFLRAHRRWVVRRLAKRSSAAMSEEKRLSFAGYKARINKFRNATSFGKFFEFCTYFAPALMTQNSFPFWNPLWPNIQTSSSVSGNSSGILVIVFSLVRL